VKLADFSESAPFPAAARFDERNSSIPGGQDAGRDGIFRRFPLRAGAIIFSFQVDVRGGFPEFPRSPGARNGGAK
jgi:hypothetical protein